MPPILEEVFLDLERAKKIEHPKKQAIIDGIIATAAKTASEFTQPESMEDLRNALQRNSRLSQRASGFSRDGFDLSAVDAGLFNEAKTLIEMDRRVREEHRNSLVGAHAEYAATVGRKEPEQPSALKIVWDKIKRGRKGEKVKHGSPLGRDMTFRLRPDQDVPKEQLLAPEEAMGAMGEAFNKVAGFGFRATPLGRVTTSSQEEAEKVTAKAMEVAHEPVKQAVRAVWDVGRLTLTDERAPGYEDNVMLWNPEERRAYWKDQEQRHPIRVAGIESLPYGLTPYIGKAKVPKALRLAPTPKQVGRTLAGMSDDPRLRIVDPVNPDARVGAPRSAPGEVTGRGEGRGFRLSKKQRRKRKDEGRVLEERFDEVLGKPDPETGLRPGAAPTRFPDPDVTPASARQVEGAQRMVPEEVIRVTKEGPRGQVLDWEPAGTRLRPGIAEFPRVSRSGGQVVEEVPISKAQRPMRGGTPGEVGPARRYRDPSTFGEVETSPWGKVGDYGEPASGGYGPRVVRRGEKRGSSQKAGGGEMETILPKPVTPSQLKAQMTAADTEAFGRFSRMMGVDAEATTPSRLAEVAARFERYRKPGSTTLGTGTAAAFQQLLEGGGKALWKPLAAIWAGRFGKKTPPTVPPEVIQATRVGRSPVSGRLEVYLADNPGVAAEVAAGEGMFQRVVRNGTLLSDEIGKMTPLWDEAVEGRAPYLHKKDLAGVPEGAERKWVFRDGEEGLKDLSRKMEAIEEAPTGQWLKDALREATTSMDEDLGFALAALGDDLIGVPGKYGGQVHKIYRDLLKKYGTRRRVYDEVLGPDGILSHNQAKWLRTPKPKQGDPGVMNPKWIPDEALPPEVTAVREWWESVTYPVREKLAAVTNKRNRIMGIDAPILTAEDIGARHWVNMADIRKLPGGEFHPAQGGRGIEFGRRVPHEKFVGATKRRTGAIPEEDLIYSMAYSMEEVMPRVLQKIITDDAILDMLPTVLKRAQTQPGRADLFVKILQHGMGRTGNPSWVVRGIENFLYTSYLTQPTSAATNLAGGFSVLVGESGPYALVGLAHRLKRMGTRDAKKLNGFLKGKAKGWAEEQIAPADAATMDAAVDAYQPYIRAKRHQRLLHDPRRPMARILQPSVKDRVLNTGSRAQELVLTPFEWSERQIREISVATFAYQGIKKGLVGLQPGQPLFEFIRKRIVRTQGLYNRMTRPGLMRRPVARLAGHLSSWTWKWWNNFARDLRTPGRRKFAATRLASAAGHYYAGKWLFGWDASDVTMGPDLGDIPGVGPLAERVGAGNVGVLGPAPFSPGTVVEGAERLFGAVAGPNAESRSRDQEYVLQRLISRPLTRWAKNSLMETDPETGDEIHFGNPVKTRIGEWAAEGWPYEGFWPEWMQQRTKEETYRTPAGESGKRWFIPGSSIETRKGFEASQENRRKNRAILDREFFFRDRITGAAQRKDQAAVEDLLVRAAEEGVVVKPARLKKWLEATRLPASTRALKFYKPLVRVQALLDPDLRPRTKPEIQEIIKSLLKTESIRYLSQHTQDKFKKWMNENRHLYAED